MHTCVDIQNLLEAEKEDSKELGWKMAHKGDLVETWRKSSDDHPIHLVKVYLNNIIGPQHAICTCDSAVLQVHSDRI